MEPATKCLNWPHAPPHRLNTAGTYIVTAGTYKKEDLFNDADRLTYLTTALLTLASEHQWQLQAWAVFSNHYHFIADSQSPSSLSRFLQHLHSISAKHLNLLDRSPGRPVWFQFWETQLTFQKSFLARLNYVHSNPVRHGLVAQPELYAWCSAEWFARTATPSFCKTVMAFPSNKVQVPDEYNPLGVREPGSRFSR